MSSSETIARASTLIVTNLAKLAAIAIAVNEVLVRPTLRETAMATAALFYAGAEVLERAVLRVLKQILTTPAPEPSESKIPS